MAGFVTSWLSLGPLGTESSREKACLSCCAKESCKALVKQATSIVKCVSWIVSEVNLVSVCDSPLLHIRCLFGLVPMMYAHSSTDTCMLHCICAFVFYPEHSGLHLSIVQLLYDSGLSLCRCTGRR